MNLLLLTSRDLRSDAGRFPIRASVTGRRAEHIRQVLGAEVGATVEVGLLGGLLGSATLVAIEKGEILLDVSLGREPPPRFDLRLVLALPRPKSLRRILQGCAAMGVRSIFLVNSWRVQKSYWGSPLLEDDAIQRELSYGLEQGRDTILPEVHLCPLFKPFVEDRLDEVSRGTLKLVGAPAAVEACPAAVRQPVTLVIGPEGGLIPYEEERLAEIGFVPVHLGPRALRVEQAVPAFLGRLSDLGADPS